MHYVTDGPHTDRSTQMLHEFAAHICHQLWEPTRRRALMRACTYKSLQIFTNPALFTPAGYKHQSWVWPSGVWVTGTKADGAPAYGLRRHPKDRMLIKEMHPRRPHKETRCCVLKYWIHNHRYKRIYHQRNHKSHWHWDLCAAWFKQRSLSKTKKKKTSRALIMRAGCMCVSVSICHLPSRSFLWTECQRSSGLWGVWPVWPEPSGWPTLLEHDVNLTTPNTHTHIYKVMSVWFMYSWDLGGGAKGSTHTVIIPERPTRMFMYDGWSTTEADIISIFMIADEFKCTECRNKQSTEAVSYLHVNKTFAAKELRPFLGGLHWD